ncbi:MAG: 50S ribosomal protein L1 [Bdellovibrionales bacterium]|nr:50S ribosomal protein L1 [Bdellovibrionales bacterium]
MALSKRTKHNLTLVQPEKKYTIDESLATIAKFKPAKFDETVNVAVRLGIDVKQSDQQVRGATVLPNGLGNKVRVVVFAKGPKATEAQSAGADFVGADDLVEKINGGWMDFDKVIATPDMMVAVSKVGKILGPRGLMPNPKTGTVTNDVTKAINEERKGKVEFRAEKAGIVHAPIGKVSFGAEKLKQNLMSLMESVVKMKPSTSKGVYLRSVTLSPAMGPGLRLDASQFAGAAASEE